ERALDRSVSDLDFPIIPVLLPNALRTGTHWDPLTPSSYLELDGTLDDGDSVTVEDDFDDPEDLPLRVPTGATGGGPAGELVAGDVVAGSFPLGGVQSFTLVGTAGEAFIGAQTTNDADLTITVTDPATGQELAFSDDFVGFDPEAFLRLDEGQVVTVTVGSFADADAGEFVVYYER
ncbi:MAG TPA: hypothetical protein VFG94_01665, partial [Acidimicrobiales bacterium]|nr:hypothetical protein [Acidimicrobiales bacterium]